MSVPTMRALAGDGVRGPSLHSEHGDGHIAGAPSTEPSASAWPPSRTTLRDDPEPQAQTQHRTK